MNKEWLEYFGIVSVEKVDVSVNNHASAVDVGDVIKRYDKKALLCYPLSSSGSERLRLYDDSDRKLSDDQRSQNVRSYEMLCRTDGPLKKSKKKILNNVHRKRLRKPGIGPLSIKKRAGPSARVSSLNLTKSSPYFQFSRSVMARRTRHRQLEFGLTKAARDLARKLQSCTVVLSKLHPQLIEAYTRKCRVLVDRVVYGQTEEGVYELISYPSVNITRLTPDQVATGLLTSTATLRRGLLQVRLSRILATEEDLSASILPDECHCRAEGSLCVVCELKCMDHFKLPVAVNDSHLQRQHGGVHESLMTTDVSVGRMITEEVLEPPRFLTPCSPQRSGILEPEEVALLGDLTLTAVYPDSGESCEIASLTSSSATSVVPSVENSLLGFPVSFGRWRDYTSSPLTQRNPQQFRKRRQFHRNASYPQTNDESFIHRKKDIITYINSQSTKSNRKKKAKCSTLPSSTSCPHPKRHCERTLKRKSTEGSHVLTRCRSRTSTDSVIIFQTRSRSSANSRFYRR